MWPWLSGEQTEELLLEDLLTESEQLAAQALSEDYLAMSARLAISSNAAAANAAASAAVLGGLRSFKGTVSNSCFGAPK
jgi:hypothetical protein